MPLAPAVPPPRVPAWVAQQVSLPRIAGVALGDTAGAVLAVLGSPERRQTALGLVFWDYERRGLSVMWDGAAPGVRGVVVRTAGAGEVDGIRVGDAVARVRARWGDPVRVRQEGRFLDFVRGTWLCAVELRDDRVVEITVIAK